MSCKIKQIVVFLRIISKVEDILLSFINGTLTLDEAGHFKKIFRWWGILQKGTLNICRIYKLTGFQEYSYIHCYRPDNEKRVSCLLLKVSRAL